MQKTNVMLFHLIFYYFHQFIVKNYKCPDLSFCYFIKKNLIFLLQVVASKYDDWLQSYDKNAKTPEKKERKMKKIVFSLLSHVLTENISQN